MVGDIRPGHVGTVADERVDPIDVTATLVDLAVRGHLLITELPRDTEFARTRLGADPAERCRRAAALRDRAAGRHRRQAGGTVKVSELSEPGAGVDRQRAGRALRRGGQQRLVRAAPRRDPQPMDPAGPGGPDHRRGRHRRCWRRSRPSVWSAWPWSCWRSAWCSSARRCRRGRRRGRAAGRARRAALGPAEPPDRPDARRGPSCGRSPRCCRTRSCWAAPTGGWTRSWPADTDVDPDSEDLSWYHGPDELAPARPAGLAEELHHHGLGQPVRPLTARHRALTGHATPLALR